MSAGTTKPATKGLLVVRDLCIAFGAGDEQIQVVDSVSFAVRPGEIFGLVGESGSGKTLTALAVLGLLPPHCQVLRGQVEFESTDLLGLSRRELRKVRGGRIGMVFQDPMSSLNPSFTIGSQLSEAIRAHQTLSRAHARQKAVELLAQVGITMPESRLRQYPHELSGGIRQRVAIAMALSCDPHLLIADEPTTALDVTIQAQVLDQLAERQQAAGLSMLLITHDFGVICELADRVAVMYAGRIVEEGPVHDIIETPLHPYTKALVGAVPRMDRKLEHLATMDRVSGSASTNLGCRFAPRCAYRQTACEMQDVLPIRAAERRTVACLRWQQISSPDE